MLKKRVITGIFVALFGFLTGFFGGVWLCAGMCLVSLQALFELYRAHKLEKSSFAVISYVITVVIYVFAYFELNQYMIYLLIVSILFYMGLYVFKFPKYRFTDVFTAFGGVFYISVMLLHVFLVRRMEGGIFYIWLIYAGSWGSDVGAFTFGSLFGKHKLVPKLSPKKTIEGAVGGIVASALWGLLHAFLFSRYLDVVMPFLTFPLVAAACSIVAQIGDLAASAIKRQCEIKDYGICLPGHGGMLDRYDSIIFVAPLVHFVLSIIISVSAV